VVGISNHELTLTYKVARKRSWPLSAALVRAARTRADLVAGEYVFIGRSRPTAHPAPRRRRRGRVKPPSAGLGVCPGLRWHDTRASFPRKREPLSSRKTKWSRFRGDDETCGTGYFIGATTSSANRQACLVICAPGE
jgi:hypothetical protein